MNGILSGVLDENKYTLEIRPAARPLQISLIASVESAIRRGASIINMSFGSANCAVLSVTLRDILKQECYKTDQEFLDAFDTYKKLFQQSPATLFVIGAGNGDIDASQFLPAAISLFGNVITVGATDLDDKRAEFVFPEKSNFGSTVNLSAPGKNVYAPAPNNQYDSNFSGTSASAPMVTGVAGLLKAIKSDLTPAELKAIITRTADPIKTGEPDKPLGRGCFRRSDETGCRLNAERAVKDLLFDFAVDRFEADGNILGSGGQDGIADFIDNFNDGSLTAPPTSSFIFSQPVVESGGFLHLRAADGARTISRFGSRFFEDDMSFLPTLRDGGGDSVITATFRADDVLPDQFYGLGVQNTGPGLTESTAMAIIFSRSSDGNTAVLVNDNRAAIIASDRFSLTGTSKIILRLFINDSTNTVVPSYSIDNGVTFIGPAQFDFFAHPGTIFTTTPNAQIFLQGGVRLK